MMSFLMIALMVLFSILAVWIYVSDPMDRPPVFLMIIMIGVPAIVILGILWNLWKRYQEIKGGEEDAAAKY